VQILSVLLACHGSLVSLVVLALVLVLWRHHLYQSMGMGPGAAAPPTGAAVTWAQDVRLALVAYVGLKISRLCVSMAGVFLWQAAIRKRFTL
jgi:cobalamin synthase